MKRTFEHLKIKNMKTIKTFIAAALVVLTISASAIERPRMELVPVNTERAVITVANENPALFELSIYSKRGDMVYYKQTTEMQKDYQKIYDFKNLTPGKYVLSLKVNDTEVTNDFEVGHNGINVGKKKVSYDPFFLFENNELKISYLNFDKEKLNLVIYGDDGVVYKSQLGNEFNVVKGYDLSKLTKGRYTVVLNSFNKEYSYNLEK